MKINFKNIQKEIASGDIFRRIGSFLGGNIKKLIFLLFFISSAYCGYIWYSFVYNPKWSVDKEAAYLKTKDKEVTFNRKKFQDIVDKEKKRAEEYAKTVGEVADIFRIDQLQPQPQEQPQSPQQPQQATPTL